MSSLNIDIKDIINIAYKDVPSKLSFNSNEDVLKFITLSSIIYPYTNQICHSNYLLYCQTSSCLIHLSTLNSHKEFITKMFYILIETILIDPNKCPNGKILELLFGKITQLYKLNYFNNNEMLLYVKFIFVLGSQSFTNIKYSLILFDTTLKINNDNNISNPMIFNIVKFIKDNLSNINNKEFLISKLTEVNELLMFDNVDINEQTQNELNDLLSQINLFQFSKKFFDAIVNSTIYHFDNINKKFSHSLNAKIALINKLINFETQYLSGDPYCCLNGFYLSLMQKEGIELSEFKCTEDKIKNLSFIFSFKSIIKTEDKIPLLELNELDENGNKTGNTLLTIFVEQNALFIETKKGMRFPSNKTSNQSIPIFVNSSYLIIGSLSEQNIRLCAMKDNSKIDIQDYNFKHFPNFDKSFSLLIGKSCTLEKTFSGYIGNVFLFNSYFTDDEIEALTLMKGNYEMFLYSDQHCQFVHNGLKKEIKPRVQKLLISLIGMVTTFGIKEFNKDKKRFKENVFDFERLNKVPKYFTLGQYIKPIQSQISIYEFIKYDGLKYIQLHCEYYMQILEKNDNKYQYLDIITLCVENILNLIESLILHLKLDFFEKERSDTNNMNTFIDISLSKLSTYSNQIIFLFSSITQLYLKINTVFKKCPVSLIKRLIDIGTLLCLEEDDFNISLRNKIMFFLFNKELYQYDKTNLFNTICETVKNWLQNNNKKVPTIFYLDVVIENKTLQNLNNNNYIELIYFLVNESLCCNIFSLSFLIMEKLLTCEKYSEENIEFAYKMISVLYNSFFEVYFNLIKEDPYTMFFDNQNDIIRNFIINEIKVLDNYKSQGKDKLTKTDHEKINMSKGQLIQMCQLLECDKNTLSQISENVIESVPMISLFLLVLEIITPNNYIDIINSAQNNLESLEQTKNLRMNYVKLDIKLEIMVKLYNKIPNSNQNKNVFRKIISLIIIRLINDNFKEEENNGKNDAKNNIINQNRFMSNQQQNFINNIKPKEKGKIINNIFQKKNIIYTFYNSWDISEELSSELELIINAVLFKIQKPSIFKLIFMLFIKAKNNQDQLAIICNLYNQIATKLDKKESFTNKTRCINLFYSIILMYKIISLSNLERDLEKKKDVYLYILNNLHFNEIIINSPDILYSRIKFHVGSIIKEKSSTSSSMLEKSKKWKYINEIFIEIFIEAFLITNNIKYMNLLEFVLYLNENKSKTILFELDEKIIEGPIENKNFFSKLFTKSKPQSKITIEKILNNEQAMLKYGNKFAKFTNISYLIFYFLKFSFYTLNPKKHDQERTLSNFYVKIRLNIMTEIQNISKQIKSHQYQQEYDEPFYQKFKSYFYTGFNKIITKQKIVTSSNSLSIKLPDIDNVIISKNKKEKYNKAYNDYFAYVYDENGTIKFEQNELEIRKLTKNKRNSINEYNRKDLNIISQLMEINDKEHENDNKETENDNKENDNDNEKNEINETEDATDKKEDEGNIFSDFISSREELLILISNAIKEIQKTNKLNDDDDTAVNNHYNLFPYFNSRKIFLYVTFAEYFKDKIFYSKAFELLANNYKKKYYYTYLENSHISYLKYPTKLRNYFSKTAKHRILLKPDLKFFTHPKIKASHGELYDFLTFKNTHTYFVNRLYLNKDKIINTISPIKQFKCEMITLLGSIFGELLITNNYIIFISKYNEDPRINSKSTNNKMDCILSSVDTEIINKEKFITIRFEQIEQIFPKRFLYSMQASEIFLKNGKSYLFNLFSLDNNEILLKEIESLKPKIITRDLTKQINDCQLDWINNKLSTFNYISFLNFASGRSYNDINQYPIFPWLTLLDLDSNCSKVTIRNFSYPISIQSKDTRNEIISIFKGTTPNKHGFVNHFHLHYSNIMTVCYYLVRLNPFAFKMISLQNNTFDCPSRLFHSFYELLTLLINLKDNRELVPELFYLPEIFVNLNYFNFGKRNSDTIRVHNLLFEDYYERFHDNNTLSTNNPVEFMCRYRRLLESKVISNQIHNWIDNIFGIYQYIKDYKENLTHCNTFHKYSYEENISLINKLNSMYEKKLDDEIIWNKIRNKINKILNLGQCPKKIFTTPHQSKQQINQRNSSHRNTFNQSKSNLQLSTPTNDSNQNKNSTLTPKQIPNEQVITIDEMQISKHVLSFKSILLSNGVRKYFILQNIPNKGKQLITYKKEDTNFTTISVNNFTLGLYHYYPLYNKNQKTNQSYSKIKNIFNVDNIYTYFHLGNNNLYIFTNYYDKSIKCYFENQQQQISYVTSSFVTVIKKINKKEFITGHENGLLIHWIVNINDAFEKQNISLIKKKSIISQQGPVLSINYNYENNFIITGDKNGFVSIRNLYSFELLNVIKPQNFQKNDFLIIHSEINKSNGLLYILGYNKNKGSYSLFGYTINGVRFSVLDNIAGRFQILNNGLIMCYSYGERRFVVMRGENLVKFKTKVDCEIEGKVIKFWFLEDEMKIKYLKMDGQEVILDEIKVSYKTILDINKEDDVKEEGGMSIWDSIEYESDIKVFNEEDNKVDSEIE